MGAFRGSGVMGEHSYPSNFAPGPEQHWAVNEAWGVLDCLPVGLLSVEQRALLAGRIAGTLMRVDPKRGC
jgi:hypothetical protein